MGVAVGTLVAVLTGVTVAVLVLTAVLVAVFGGGTVAVGTAVGVAGIGVADGTGVGDAASVGVAPPPWPLLDCPVELSFPPPQAATAAHRHAMAKLSAPRRMSCLISLPLAEAP